MRHYSLVTQLILHVSADSVIRTIFVDYLKLVLGLEGGHVVHIACNSLSYHYRSNQLHPLVLGKISVTRPHVFLRLMMSQSSHLLFTILVHKGIAKHVVF